jgi:hypothetical protein
MITAKRSLVAFGLCSAWIVYQGVVNGWTVSEIVPLAAIIVVFAASWMGGANMGLFGKSEYEKQLEVSAKQQAEAARQFEITERHQREYEAFLARSREQQDRYTKLLDVWEEQARRFDALLAKWEQKS